ncbi:hypothetical protein C0991_001711 [Blastosporella zonata]|nr:hypothetical protein C0991_001711 [Blastosporella zonata]
MSSSSSSSSPCNDLQTALPPDNQDLWMQNGYGNNGRPSNIPRYRPSDLQPDGFRPPNGFGGSYCDQPYQYYRQETDPAFMNFAAQVATLAKQNAQLHQDVKELKQELSMTRKDLTEMLRDVKVALEGVSRSSEAPSTDTLPLPAMSEDNYPFVKFWTAKLYHTAKKTRKSLTGLDDVDNNGNTMTWYVETEDGEPVDSKTVEKVRGTARTIWHELYLRGIAPVTWAEAGLVAHNYFKHHMCRQFPQLSYGENNWKCHMIATQNYSSWYSKHVGRATKVKSEPIKHEMKAELGISQQNQAKKRSVSPSETTDATERAAKRSREGSEGRNEGKEVSKEPIAVRTEPLTFTPSLG